MRGSQKGRVADGRRTDVPCLVPSVIRELLPRKSTSRFGSRFFDTWGGDSCDAIEVDSRVKNALLHSDAEGGSDVWSSFE